jgi:hypothetical protein
MLPSRMENKTYGLKKETSTNIQNESIKELTNSSSCRRCQITIAL